MPPLCHGCNGPYDSESDWESESTAVLIYLADKLPVSVHLGFDESKDITISSQEALAFGMEIPNGQNMAIDVEFVAH